MIMIIMIGGMCMAMQMTSLSTQRAARISHDLHRSATVADSAISYFQLQLESDANYFVANPAPHDARPIGNATFRLVAATQSGGSDDWLLDVIATSDGVDYRIQSVLRPEVYSLPHGLVLTGTGNPADDILRMNGASEFGSYDPAVGTGVTNDSASVWANGSIVMMGTALIQGDVTASGWVSTFGPSTVAGSLDEGAADSPSDPFEELATPIIAEAATTNDNGGLAAVFGAGWTPSLLAGSSGSLSLSGGTYALTAGTYNFDDIALSSGTQLVLDTSGGPITIVVNGSSGLEVDSGSQVLIDSGGTDHGVQTVLADGASLVVQGGSLYGQNPADPFASGYSQVLAAGENGTIESQGGSTAFARVAAPDRSLFVGGSSHWYGSAVVRNAEMIGSDPKFLIDESLQGRGIGFSGEYEVVARWRGALTPSGAAVVAP